MVSDSERMSHHPGSVDSDFPAARNSLLWFAVLGGPAAWSVDHLVSFFLHQSYCAAVTSHQLIPFRAPRLWMLLVGIVTGAVAVLAALAALRAMRAVGSDSGRDGTSLDRRRFMAHAGLIMSVLFLYGIVLITSGIAFVDPSVCTLGS